MRCRKINIMLSALLDGEISLNDQRMVESHILKCSRCRENYDELLAYAALTKKLEAKKAPVSLGKKVWAALETGNKGKTISLHTTKAGKATAWFRVAAAIGAIIIGLTFIPYELLRTPEIESSFITETVKGGKGPVREKGIPREKSRGKGPAENAQAEWLINIASDQGAAVKKIIYLEPSQKISYIVLKISVTGYDEFRRAYNSVQSLKPLPEFPGSKLSNKVRLVIGFPVHSFVSGDFNGDGYSDMATHIAGSRANGKWFISFNDQSGAFNNPSEVRFKDYPVIHPPYTTIAAGDFNGDQLDDLVVWINREDSEATVMLYINKKRHGFTKTSVSNIPVPPNIESSSIQAQAGDVDGDGLEDILLCSNSIENTVTWMSMINSGEGNFKEPVLLYAGHKGWDTSARYKSFVLDVNADGLADTGIYGQGGEREARWYVSENKGNGVFETEVNLYFGNSSKAFQGDYSLFTGDLNGDGYTDLMVKYGSQKAYSNWIRLFNKKDMNFSLGEELKFGSGEDFALPGK